MSACSKMMFNLKSVLHCKNWAILREVFDWREFKVNCLVWEEIRLFQWREFWVICFARKDTRLFEWREFRIYCFSRMEK